MEEFKIASFYTKDSPYKEILNTYLMPSLVKLNLVPLIAIEENTHNWHQNVAKKPLIALQMLEEQKDTNIVFLDADCTVESYPALFHIIPSEYDIALYVLDWDTWYRNNSGVKEVLSGTLFLRNNDKVKELCKEWSEETIRTGVWEQKALGKVLERRKDIKVFELPISYCYIDTLPNGKEPYVKCDDVIIRHHQVSRVFKRKGNL